MGLRHSSHFGFNDELITLNVRAICIFFYFVFHKIYSSIRSKLHGDDAPVDKIVLFILDKEAL